MKSRAAVAAGRALARDRQRGKQTSPLLADPSGTGVNEETALAAAIREDDAAIILFDLGVV